VFQSQARIVAADTNKVMDIYTLDRESGTYTLVSRSTSGVVGNAGSFNPSITPDGRYVVFTSDATNFIADDTNDSSDIFLFERDSGVTKRISSSTGGASADGPSGTAVVSADGAYVAYSSQAANLVAGDSNLKSDIFVYRRSDGTTRRVSVGWDGVQSNGDSYYPAISADGLLVTFQSAASNLVSEEVGYRSDVFLYDQTLN